MERRPTIAINALSATIGGGLTVARGLCTGLARVRPNWSILYLHSRPEAATGLGATNLKLVMLPQLASAARRLVWEQTSLNSYLKREEVDAAILLGGFAPRRCSVPMISVWQNLNICTSVKVVSSWKLRAYILVQRFWMRVSLSRARLHVFLSKDSANHCARMMPLDPNRTAIIAIGIDDRFHRQPAVPDRDARRPILVAISDLYRHKRIELVIDAFARVHRELPHLRCVIAGRPVDESHFNELEDRVRAAGLEAFVEFRGGIDASQVLSLYREGLVYITTSRLETFGLTPIEAMASGLPVVAASASALPEIGGNAVALIEGDSAEQFASAIRELCTDPVEWRRRQSAGLERSRIFSWDLIAERYAEEIERQLVDRRPEPDLR